MALQFDNSRCVRSPLQRRVTEEIMLPSESCKRKNEFVFSACKKRKIKGNCDPYRYGQKSKCKKLRPEAPFNSTQFIMEEHDNLSDKDLSVEPKRRREDSFSMDSDDPEEEAVEDEFLRKEYWSTYEDVHAERLDTMTKNQLVQEFLSLEEKICNLERKLHNVRKQDMVRIREPSPADEDEEINPPGEVPVDSETAAKIEIFSNEIRKLELENESLQSEKISLRHNTTCMRCGFPSDCRSMSSSSDEDSINHGEVNSCNMKYINLDSNTDSGMASFEGNTSSSSEELIKDESIKYVCEI